MGLDIGSALIKLVKLKFVKDTQELVAFDLQPAGTDVLPALKEIAQSRGVSKVNIALSGSSTIIRNVIFPKMDSQELRQALKFEAQKHIPFSVDEVNLDCHILKRELPENKMLVMIAAVKKDFINQRLKALEAAGLTVNVAEIDSLSLINAFNFNYGSDESMKQKAVALFNIGASQSNLTILEGGLFNLSRDINIAGNNFTQKLADVLNLDFKSAEDLKLNPADKEKMPKISTAIEAVTSSIAMEIRISFDYYESQSSSSIAGIFLCGGGSLFPGFKDMLASMLDMDVQYWDPLGKISISNDVDKEKIKAVNSQLAVATGLALRG